LRADHRAHETAMWHEKKISTKRTVDAFYS